MSAANGRAPDGGPSRLRHDIDSGRTGDKVAALDPAAAPLGTDEEAAGTPTPPAATAAARSAERRGALGDPQLANTDARRRTVLGRTLTAVAIVALVAALAWVVLT